MAGLSQPTSNRTVEIINNMKWTSIFDSDFSRILIKVFVIPALILSIFYIFVFNERYKTQIDALKHMQMHHLQIAKDMGNYELRNIVADSQLILNNSQIQKYVKNPSGINKSAVINEFKKQINFQDQYLAIALCDSSNNSPIHYIQTKFKKNTTKLFCNSDRLLAADRHMINIHTARWDEGQNIAIISTKSTSTKESNYIEIIYNANNIINIIGNTSGHNDRFYIIPDKDTIWMSGYDEKHGRHENDSILLMSQQDELKRILEQPQGQFSTNNGIFTYNVLSLDQELIGNKTSWKIVCHNYSTDEIFQQELMYFVALSAISLFTLFFISLVYYSLSKTSRRIHMELYEDKETGLYNKKFLENQLPLLIEQSRHFDNKLICIYVDLDNFLNLASTEGQEASRYILISVAKHIQKCVRKSDIVSRVGEDKFVILMPFIEKLYIGARTAAKILEELNNNIFYKGKHIEVSASIGISNYPQHGDQLGTILTAADLAMYDVKNDSQNGYKMADAFEL